MALTQDFQRALTRLDNTAQANVQGAILKLQQGHTATDLHKLEGVDLHAFGVNQNALRIICKRDGNMLMLLHVDAHDRAYGWAKRHRVVQFGQVVRIVRTITEEEAVAASPDVVVVPGPLHAVPTKHFRHFELEQDAAEFLKTVPTQDALLNLILCFLPWIGEAILALATDPDDLQHIEWVYHEAVRQQASAAGPPPPPTLAEAVKDDVNAGDFFVPTTDEALRVALEHGLESWHVFLHPSQKRLTERSCPGAFKVTGGPGTGKTVVALHRTRYLTEKAFADDPRPVLLTTFSRVLAMELERSLKVLCEDKPELLGRVVVRTLTRVAQDLLAASSHPSSFLDGSAVDQCWREAMTHETLGRDAAFYASERDHVVARQGAWTEPQYLRASREGRKSRLDRVQKRRVWKVLEIFEDAMTRLGGGDGHSLAREAARLVISGELESPFAAVVCDELQDVTASDLRLLAALTRDREAGTTRPNSLFVVGDAYQSLYRRPVALALCGIDVRGKSAVLKRNYRTTEGIRRAAIEVVKGVKFDGNEEEVEQDVFDGYASVRQGGRPIERAFPTPEAEADWIADIARDGAPGPLLVLTRTNAWRDGLAERLKTRGLAPKVLEGQDSLRAEDALVLCTLHRSKGLEAPRVIVAGTHQIPQGWPGKGDAGEKIVWDRQEKCLLYVGMTRARDWCGLSRVDKG